MTSLAPGGWNTMNEPVINHLRRDYTALKVDQNVGEALVSLRSAKLAEKIVYFYVVDQEGRLVGVVPTRRLLMSQAEEPLADIMVKHVISIPHSMSVADACEFFVMHRLLAFPVVDAENRLIGTVDVNLFTDEMFGLSERQSAQDVFQLIGVRLAQIQRASPWSAFRGRFPWLLCNISGGIAAAFLVGLYEDFLDSVIVLALFIPVVLALAESVSIQSMTITLQGLHDERTGWRGILRGLRTEFLTACLLGMASGLLVGAVALIWKGNAAVGVAIAASIACAIVTACLLGVLLPTAVRMLRGNPQIASGPIVLATADMATLLFYFNLAGVILR